MDLKQLLKHCLNYKVIAAVLALIAAAYFFAPQFAQYSWILLALVCPLSMILMMYAMNGKDGSKEKLFVCPECGFSYRDAEWAKKCAAWCKEHKSCNLEITAHSVKS